MEVVGDDQRNEAPVNPEIRLYTVGQLPEQPAERIMKKLAELRIAR
jgi:adenylylsulfate kinase-like enzyme